MNVLILYESITGNTKLGVEIIQLVLEKMGHSCSVVRFGEMSPSETGGRDLYCFRHPHTEFRTYDDGLAFPAPASQGGCRAGVYL